MTHESSQYFRSEGGVQTSMAQGALEGVGTTVADPTTGLPDFLTMQPQQKELEMQTTQYPVNVLGRLGAGEGAIDGADCDEDKFRSVLEFISGNALASLDDINVGTVN